jgi:hypothetical protein
VEQHLHVPLVGAWCGREQLYLYFIGIARARSFVSVCECVLVCESECVCVCKRECVSVWVCERESVCV